jgi:hypothetical protein
LSNPALWGLIRTGVWPWSTAVACVVHWRPRTGGAGLGTGSSTARAARRPRSSPERGAWAPRARQGLRDLAQGSREDLGCLPRAWNGRMRRAGVLTTLTGGGGGWISRSRCWGVLRAPGRHDPTREAPTKSERGSGSPDVHPRRGIVTAGGSSPQAVQKRFRQKEGLMSSVESSDGFLVPRRG